MAQPGRKTSGKSRVRAARASLVKNGAAGAVFGVPGDGDGDGVVATEVGGDALVRAGGELAAEHALGGFDEGGGGFHIGFVHRVDVDVDGSHAATPCVRPAST